MDAGAGAGGDGSCAPQTANGFGSNDAGISAQDFGCGDAGVPGFCDNGIRQIGPTCDPTIDALLARTPAADRAHPCKTPTNGQHYALDSDPMDPDTLAMHTADMCKLNGALYWVSDMDIDCDGKMSSVCPGTGANRDPSYQGDTATHGTNGALTSSLDRYVVIPNNNYSAVAPGAVIAVIYGNKMTYAIHGDTGPPAIIGEGSVALANALGIPPSPANGGVLGNTVTFIAFTGPGTVPNDIENQAEVDALGKALTQQFLMNNP